MLCQTIVLQELSRSRLRRILHFRPAGGRQDTDTEQNNDTHDDPVRRHVEQERGDGDTNDQDDEAEEIGGERGHGVLLACSDVVATKCEYHSARKPPDAISPPLRENLANDVLFDRHGPTSALLGHFTDACWKR